jgi:hypothetical protein
VAAAGSISEGGCAEGRAQPVRAVAVVPIVDGQFYRQCDNDAIGSSSVSQCDHVGRSSIRHNDAVKECNGH